LKFSSALSSSWAEKKKTPQLTNMDWMKGNQETSHWVLGFIDNCGDLWWCSISCITIRTKPYETFWLCVNAFSPCQDARLFPRPSKIPGRVPGHLEDVLLAEERYAKTHAVLWPSVEAPLWVSLAGASMGR
jgi:hypothetical protein